MVADGDTVVTRWRGGGTHKGGALRTVKGDIQPSGRKFEIDGMTWHRMKDGRIIESLANEDTVGLMAQLGVIPSPPGAPPDDVANRTCVRRYFEDVMNRGDLAAIEEIVDPNFTFNIPTQPEPFRGTAGFKGFVQYLRSAFPDIHFEVERQAVEGNKIAARWKITGTHRGEFLGAPATGKFIEDHGVDIFTMAKGRILAVHVNENDFGLMVQLGLIPV
jgi:steroid delta-isomerase-like uncharacterized protein